MKPRPVAFVAVLASLSVVVHGEATGISDALNLRPSPSVEEVASLGQPLDALGTAEIALIFSGVVGESRYRYREEIIELIAEAKREVDSSADPYHIGEQILEFLHDGTFVRYDESQTYVDVLLDSGLYNCVSSSVMFAIVAKAFELDVGGIVTRDHAFCTIRLGDELVDVETTTPHGYDPGRKKEFFDEFGNLTGYTYVPPSAYRERESVGARELLSLILHNRISLLDSQQRFQEALALSIDRYAFLGTDDSFRDLVREISNFVAVYNRDRRYPEALTLLQTARARYGDVGELREIQYAILNNFLIDLSRKGEFALARETIDSNLELLTSDQRSDLERMITRSELSGSIPTIAIAEGFRLVEAARAEGAVSDELLREFEISLYGRLAEEAVTSVGYLEGAAVIERAIDSIGPDSRLLRAREVYRYNYSAAQHNRFAEYFNAGKLVEARDIVEQALKFVPESALLADDLRTITRILRERG